MCPTAESGQCVRQRAVSEKPDRCAPKSGKGRSVRCSQRATEALRSHRARQNEERLSVGPLWQDHGLVFPSGVGTPLLGGNLNRAFKDLLKRAGLPEIRFHDLRHTCATLLLSKNVNAKVVSEMLGHASIAITLDTYSHVLPNMQDSAAEAIEEALS
jgi:integrase